MKVDVVMPEMGESIAEGTLAKWLKQAGDEVEKDEAILEITTDKIDSEIPAPEDGVLSEILVEEGDTVEVGAVLARIDTEGTAEETEEPKEKAKEKTKKKKKEKEEEEKEDEREKVALSPVARNIAEEEGLTGEELDQIEGSGQGGKLTKADILGYLEGRSEEGKREAAPEEVEEAVASSQEDYRDDRVEIIEMSNMRRMIAEHMVQSKRISPHTYTVAEVDMTRIVKFRESIKSRFEKEKGFKLTYTPFVLDATVQALKTYPLVNSSVDRERIIRKDYINLGIAVAIETGLIVPVVKDADEKNLLGLARSANDLAFRAQNKKLSPDDVQGGTFTVTNPGVFGNIFGLAIINQPQIGILGVGAIKKRPVVVDDAIAIRSMMYLSLSYDHRVIDGALAARFLQHIRQELEEYDTEQTL